VRRLIEILADAGIVLAVGITLAYTLIAWIEQTWG
jgi:hypothetical protein